MFLEFKKRFRQVIFFLLNFFVIVQLIIIIIFPTGSSVLSWQFPPAFVLTVNSLGLNTLWQFFSPAPSPHMYIEYEVKTEEGWENENIHYWPPRKTDGILWANYNRRLYSMRYFVLDFSRLESIFGPWICRHHPEAVATSMELIVETTPPMETMKTEFDFAGTRERSRPKSVYFDCPLKGEMS